MPMKMVYWGIKARGYLPAVIAAYGKLDFEWDSATANAWPGYKEQTVFGQIPQLEDGSVKVAQSMAIARYLSRKAGLQGDTDSDFAISEMLLEEFNDIFTTVAKAHYASPRKEAMDKTFAEDIPAQLKYLEKLLGDKTTFASKITAGDLAIATGFNVLLALEPSVLDAFPTLKKFYAHVEGLDGLAPLLGAECKHGMYFERQ